MDENILRSWNKKKLKTSKALTIQENMDEFYNMRLSAFYQKTL